MIGASEKSSAPMSIPAPAANNAVHFQLGSGSGGPSNLLAGHSPNDDEGDGEENEISVHAIRVKVYRMKKAEAKGGPGWADLGFSE
jgi:hypothetical protein